MKISLYLGVLFLALVIKIDTADVGLPNSVIQYCGSGLADIMRGICNGLYNERKRNLIENWNTNELEDTIDYPYYRSMRDVISFMPPRLLRSPKITDECCKKPCVVSELKGYCWSHTKN